MYEGTDQNVVSPQSKHVLKVLHSAKVCSDVHAKNIVEDAQQRQVLTSLDLPQVLQMQSDCALHVPLHGNLVYMAVWSFPGLVDLKCLTVSAACDNTNCSLAAECEACLKVTTQTCTQGCLAIEVLQTLLL